MLFRSEFTLLDGLCRKSGKQAGAKTGNPADFATFDDFMAALKKQLHYVIKVTVKASHIIEFKVVVEPSTTEAYASKNSISLISKTYRSFPNGSHALPSGFTRQHSRAMGPPSSLIRRSTKPQRRSQKRKKRQMHIEDRKSVV